MIQIWSINYNYLSVRSGGVVGLVVCGDGGDGDAGGGGSKNST